MARPVVITKVLAAADDDGISVSQTPLAAGNLTITGALASGGVANLGTQRRVIVTSAGNDTSVTFTVYGTNQTGNAISQAIAGASGAAAATTLNFRTVTRVAVSGATAAAVKVGTNGVGSTQWVSVTPNASQVELSVAVTVTGTISYTVEYTYDDLNYSPKSFYAYQLDNINPTPWPDATIAAKTANFVATMNDPITGTRVTINSGDGSITATFIQAGIAGN